MCKSPESHSVLTQNVILPMNGHEFWYVRINFGCIGYSINPSNPKTGITCQLHFKVTENSLGVINGHQATWTSIRDSTDGVLYFGVRKGIVHSKNVQ